MKLKICFVTQQYKNIQSGVGTYATYLIDGLAEKGHEITVICPLNSITCNKDITFIPVPKSKIDPTWILLSRQFSRRLEVVQNNKKFDIIHFTDARESFFYQYNYTPTIGTMHDYYFVTASKNPFYYKRFYKDWVKRYVYYNISKILEKKALHRLSAIITNSKFVAEKLNDIYQIPEKKLHTIYLGMESNKFKKNIDSQSSANGNNPTVLFIGGNFQRKGLPTLIQCCPTIIKEYPIVKFIIVGRDPNMNAMKDICKYYGVSEHFNFVGWISDAVKMEYYKNASILVMPSLIEGFGIVFLEAMASGVPVIGGNVGGTKELISHMKNGLLVEPNNPNQLSEYILELLNDTKLRLKITEEGKKTAKNFTVEKMVRETEMVYKKVLNGDV